MVIPSFTQTASASCDVGYVCDGYEPDEIIVIGYPWDDNWWDDDFWDDDNDDEYDSAEDDQDDDYDEPEQCSAFREAQLRALRANTPNCNGDPGATFDVNNWLNENHWQLLVNNMDNWHEMMLGSITDWLLFFSDDLSALAGVLDGNNGDLLAARNNFEEDLWETCYDTYSTSEWQTHQNLYITNGQARMCYNMSSFLMDSYMPGTNSFVAWIDSTFNTNFTAHWGSMFYENVTNNFICRAVYQAWDEENCGGGL
ncbi:hypothetical protein MNBD_GAMMA01-2205 [hydrothermal vent metagenome]|uniref:Uncharacterized protein n=1 Tax=hydrothermal vent metagenome TaxID=652676 RepID=A0A3B0V6J2_9ZZZZ